MKYLRLLLSLLTIVFTVCSYGEGLPTSFNWIHGPTQAPIGDKATIKLPEGYVYLDAQNTKRFMEANHNIAGDNEYLIARDNLSWFGLFEFEPVGYVKDDEKLDADALFKTIKNGNEQANEERKKRGWGTMTLNGWRFKPQYDNKNKLLEWALIATDDANGRQVVNYNTRILGRTGVMHVIMVSEQENLDVASSQLKNLLAGDYEYVAGEKYAEFKEGDHVAEFGLAALVAGGAAAVAAKKGFFAVIAGFFAAAWKLIVGAVIALLAGIKKMFGKKNQ